MNLVNVFRNLEVLHTKRLDFKEHFTLRIEKADILKKESRSNNNY